MKEIPIGEALHRLLHAYRRALRQAYREAGIELAISHIRSLKVIRRHQQAVQSPCTAQTIVIQLERDKGQVARIVKDLLEAELIEKRPNPDDRRSQLLQLSPTGESTLERIREAELQAGQRMAAGLRRTDMGTFVRLANAMTDNLKP